MNKEDEVTANGFIKCRDVGVAIRAKKTWTPGQPVDFQWMPSGRHTITASYGKGENNKPIKLTVLCDADSAQAVQKSFEEIIAANPRRPPFICIEHEARERAGQPLGFKWGKIEHDGGEDEGIVCTADPSALGASNVNGKVHTSFSPTFDTDADYSQLKEVNGVWTFPEGVRGSESNPARVTRLDAQSVGSLTNWNAFKEILPVAAREADAKVKAEESKVEEKAEDKAEENTETKEEEKAEVCKDCGKSPCECEECEDCKTSAKATFDAIKPLHAAEYSVARESCERADKATAAAKDKVGFLAALNVQALAVEHLGSAVARAGELGDQHAARLLSEERRRRLESVLAHEPHAAALSLFGRRAVAKARSAAVLAGKPTASRADLKAMFDRQAHAREVVAGLTKADKPREQRLKEIFGK